MKLTVITPLAIVLEAEDVIHVRAEDASGAFGILECHADMLTALAISVVTWRDRASAEHHVAVRGGMLTVQDGVAVSIVTPEAVAGDDLHRLEAEVLGRFRRTLAEEQAQRVDAQRLYLAAIRQIERLVRPDPSRGPPRLSTGDDSGEDGVP